MDSCNSQEAVDVIQSHKVLKQEPLKNVESGIFRPPKPPIVKGFIEKTGLFFRVARRYFVVNPDDGTFIRYKRFEDYPFQPL